MNRLLILLLFALLVAASVPACAVTNDPSDCVGLVWAFGETTNWPTSAIVVGNGGWVITTIDGIAQTVGTRTVNARNIVFISPYSGKSSPCEVRYTNQEMNLALLKISGTGLPAVTFADVPDFSKAQYGTLGQLMSIEKVGSNWPTQAVAVYSKPVKTGTVMTISRWNARRGFILDMQKYKALMLGDFDQEAPLPSGAVVLRNQKAVGMYVQKLTLTGDVVTLSYGQCAVSFEIAKVLQSSGLSRESLFSPPSATVKKPKNAAKLFEQQVAVYTALGIQMGANAVDAAQALVDADPKDAQARVLLGLTLTDKGRIEDAIKQFDEAVAIQPDLRTAKVRKAMLVYDMGDTPGALSQLLALNKEAPKDISAINSLITIYLSDSKTLDDALVYAKKGVDVNPTPVQYLQLVDVQRRKKDWQGAADTLGKLLKAYPDYPEAYAQLGGVFEAGEDKVNAEKAYRKWLEVDKNNPDAYLNLADFLANSDRKPEAKAVLAQLRETKPPKMALDAAQAMEDAIDGKKPAVPENKPENKPEAKPEEASGTGSTSAAPTDCPPATPAESSGPATSAPSLPRPSG